MNVHPKDEQPACRPLHCIEQLPITRICRDLMATPVGIGMCAHTEGRQPTAVTDADHLLQRSTKVAGRLANGRRHAGDQLDRALEQLMFGPVGKASSFEFAQYLTSRVAQIAGQLVDQDEFHLDAEGAGEVGGEVHDHKRTLRRTGADPRRTMRGRRTQTVRILS